jgi:hypothetical protein
MSKVHMKGRLLQILEAEGAMWDYDLAERMLTEYGQEGEYWYGTIRVTLTDLYSGGLLEVLEEALDPEKSYGKEKVLFKFGLTEFGRQRMADTGLLVGKGARE